jgi:hypothetical protein
VAIREAINKRPGIAAGAAVALAIGFCIYSYLESSTRVPRIHIPTQSYYTDDDGATYYADDIKIVPPYLHNGKTAVRAYVFKCKDGTPFVAYLEAFTPDSKKIMESALANLNIVPPLVMKARMEGCLLKTPLTGDMKWLRPEAPGYDKIAQVHCPDGGSDEDVVQVYP